MAPVINICLASDDNYAKYMGLTVLSVLKSAAPEDRLKFYILGDGITQSSKDKVESLKKIRDFEIEWFQIDINAFKNLQKNHLPYTAYARLLIPQYIKEDRVLYLDCDIFVRTSLASLFNEKIDSYYACAVEDYFLKNRGYHKKLFSYDSDNKDHDFYFNSGVLLINVKLWRQEGLQEKLIKRGEDPSWTYVHADQDVINMTLKGRIKRLDPRWNVMDYFYMPDIFLGEDIFEKLPEIIKNPYIRHFKGWKKTTLYPGRDEYYKMMLESPWSECAEPDDPKFIAYMKKFFRYMWKHPLCLFQPKTYKRLYYRGFLGLIRS